MAGMLETKRQQIVDDSGRTVRLFGVSWFGLETPALAPSGLEHRAARDMFRQIRDLGFNLVRLPFCNQLFDEGNVSTNIDLSLNPELRNAQGVQLLDELVTMAADSGLMVLLDRHRASAGYGPEAAGFWYTPDYSEDRWIADWQMLARRYIGVPAVIGADLHNEPHGSAAWFHSNPMRNWSGAARRCGNAILAENPDWLIVVEGVQQTPIDQYYWWGGNLCMASDHPVKLRVDNRLVYSPHDYPQSIYAQEWFKHPKYPRNLPRVWDDFWGYLHHTRVAAILLGEFGSRLVEMMDIGWAETMVAYLKRYQMSWVWWAWNPDSHDTGGILDDDWRTPNRAKMELLRKAM